MNPRWKHILQDLKIHLVKIAYFDFSWTTQTPWNFFVCHETSDATRRSQMNFHHSIAGALNSVIPNCKFENPKRLNDWIWVWICWFFWGEGKTGIPREKPLEARMTTCKVNFALSFASHFRFMMPFLSGYVFVRTCTTLFWGIYFIYSHYEELCRIIVGASTKDHVDENENVFWKKT